MMKKYLYAMLLTAVWLLTGCTKEDTSACFSGLRLNFNFTLHTNESGNRFGPDVQKVRVYLFDQSGILRAIQEGTGAELTNDYVMDINIAPGKYTVLAWGGSNEDFANSYHEGQMTDAANSNYVNSITIGTTTLNDFRVFLNYGIANDYPEDIIPTIDGFDDLYYGAVGTRSATGAAYLFEQVEVKAGTTTEREIELIRNTNVIKVTVSGLEYLQHYDPAAFPTRAVTRATPSDVLGVWVSARNGRYKYDNTIGEYARMMRYQPQAQSIDAGTMVVDIKTMRLDMARHTAEPMYLTIQNPVTLQTYPSAPIDVVNTLLQAKNPTTGDYVYNTQEDFDRIYEHPIEVKLNADLSVRIFVQGWEIVTLTPTPRN